eukprot:TRINITY_DN32748_c0_g1_i1.p1 TRINITY_DN32748_c0_g1~~TRINITY_DN32748_c0_g1_i1.p1  ORF type:complete len:993 (+),score=147.89 TRINITY_DN32748_c0_g1_i1:318-2981(+)
MPEVGLQKRPTMQRTGTLFLEQAEVGLQKRPTMPRSETLLLEQAEVGLHKRPTMSRSETLLLDHAEDHPDMERCDTLVPSPVGTQEHEPIVAPLTRVGTMFTTSKVDSQNSTKVGEAAALSYFKDAPEKVDMQKAVFKKAAMMAASRSDFSSHFEAARLDSTGVPFLRTRVRKSGSANTNPSFPDYVIQEMSLVHDGDVVEGFRYSTDPENPKIVYDLVPCFGCYCYPTIKREKETEGLAYARLLTKNSTQKDLWGTIVTAGFEIIDWYSHVLFLAVILMPGRLTGLPPILKYCFVITFFTCDFFLWILAWERARKDWEQDVQSEEGGFGSMRGDLIISSHDRRLNCGKVKELDGFDCCPNWCDMIGLRYAARWLWRRLSSFCTRRAPATRSREQGYQRLLWYREMQVFVQLLLMEYFGIRRRMTDGFIQLHPFHEVMPWCAFRKDGARGLLLGYADKSMFRYEDSAGMELTIPVQTLMKLLLLPLKLLTTAKLPFNLALPLMILPTVWGLYVKFVKWRILKRCRRDLKCYLKGAMHKDKHDRVARELYIRHFGPDRLAYQLKMKVRTIKKRVGDCLAWRRFRAEEADSDTELFAAYISRSKQVAGGGSAFTGLAFPGAKSAGLSSGPAAASHIGGPSTAFPLDGGSSRSGTPGGASVSISLPTPGAHSASLPSRPALVSPIGGPSTTSPFNAGSCRSGGTAASASTPLPGPAVATPRTPRTPRRSVDARRNSRPTPTAADAAAAAAFLSDVGACGDDGGTASPTPFFSGSFVTPEIETVDSPPLPPVSTIETPRSEPLALVRADSAGSGVTAVLPAPSRAVEGVASQQLYSPFAARGSGANWPQAAGVGVSSPGRAERGESGAGGAFPHNRPNRPPQRQDTVFLSE